MLERAQLQERDNKGSDCGEKKNKNNETRRDSYRRYGEKEMEIHAVGKIHVCITYKIHAVEN